MTRLTMAVTLATALAATACSDDGEADLCGNGVQDPGESCDDGNTADGDGCDQTCVVEATPTAFHITQMNMADPHAFAVGALDVTNTVNQMITDGIELDLDEDGLLDFAVVPVFRPMNQADGVSTPLDIVFADCTAPFDGTSCSRPADGQVVSTMAQNGSDTCMTPDAGTTGGYDPPIALPAAPCFASGEASFSVQLGELSIPMENARIAATYQGDPGTGLANGLVKGFVSEASADTIILPENLVLVGGEPLSSLLKDEDKDTGPGGASGWWFYLNFTAETVAYTD